MNIKIITTQNILERGVGSRLKLLKIIQSFPGIRYNDLIRTTGFNNGTLSHHLATLEKNSRIKILRLENSNITRHFSASNTKKEAIIIGFLKIKVLVKL
jgi:predicted transcriptional regulator